MTSLGLVLPLRSLNNTHPPCSLSLWTPGQCCAHWMTPCQAQTNGLGRALGFWPGRCSIMALHSQPLCRGWARLFFFPPLLLHCSILLQALKYREKQHSMCLFFFKATFIIANLFLLCCVAGDRYQVKRKSPLLTMDFLSLLNFK